MNSAAWDTRACGAGSGSSTRSCSRGWRRIRGGCAVWNSKRLVLAHLWFAFAGFGLALLLGEWQMLVRSQLHAWIGNPEWYYPSVTAHGTTMAYVFPALVAMGFGYFVAEK